MALVAASVRRRRALRSRFALVGRRDPSGRRCRTPGVAGRSPGRRSWAAAALRSRRNHRAAAGHTRSAARRTPTGSAAAAADADADAGTRKDLVRSSCSARGKSVFSAIYE